MLSEAATLPLHFIVVGQALLFCFFEKDPEILRFLFLISWSFFGNILYFSSWRNSGNPLRLIFRVEGKERIYLLGYVMLT